MAEETAVAEPFDTDQQQLGALYAKALLGAAGDEAESVLEELDALLDEVLAKQPKLGAVLSSPRVPHADKERMLDTALGGKMSPVLLNFLKVCSRRRRLDCLGAMRSEAWHLFNEMRGRVEVQVATAAPLEAARREALQEQLGKLLGAQVVLLTRVDPELIGGLVVRVGDTVYDGSVSNRLSRFRDEALKNVAATVRASIDKFSSNDSA